MLQVVGVDKPHCDLVQTSLLRAQRLRQLHPKHQRSKAALCESAPRSTDGWWFADVDLGMQLYEQSADLLALGLALVLTGREKPRSHQA